MTSGSPEQALPVPTRGLLDTTVFIARESGRPIDASRLPEESAVSVITIAELHAGVLAAADTDIRARRLATLESIADVHALAVDEAAARVWARMRVHLCPDWAAGPGQRPWIAAVAAANSLPVVTQDDDFDSVRGVAGLAVIRV